MINECYRVFRHYSGFTVEEVSEYTGVPVERIMKIEMGETVPTEAETRKIAALYNVNSCLINGSLSDICDFVVHEEFDESLYRTSFDKTLVKEMITSLNEDERMILALYRGVENKQLFLEEMLKLIENMKKI